MMRHVSSTTFSLNFDFELFHSLPFLFIYTHPPSPLPTFLNATKRLSETNQSLSLSVRSFFLCWNWMRNQTGGAPTMTVEKTTFHRPKFGSLLHSDPTSLFTIGSHDFSVDDDFSHHHHRHSNVDAPTSGLESALSSNNSSPYLMSPWSHQAPAAPSPYSKSPWFFSSPSAAPHHGFHDYEDHHGCFPPNGLIGSLVREEGHIYSLAVSDDLLYTGSDSKNIRVWKNLKDFAGFKSSSGLVKAIVISGEKIFTGHQDGKIRVWKFTKKNPTSYKRIGSLPTLKDYVKSSMNPKNYVEVRRRKNKVKIKHFDAVSSLSLVEGQGLLYSGSWDKTLKVWRLSDSKCLESIHAHEDAVNSVVAGLHGFVFTGSADGTVKMWRREMVGKGKTSHHLDRILLRQENAVTALAVNHEASVVYCGSSDGLLNFWEADGKGNLCHGGVLKGHKLAILCLAAGGNLVFSGSADKNICVWKREESGMHSCLSVLTGHTGPVKCIAVEEERSAEASEEEEEEEGEEGEEEEEECRHGYHHGVPTTMEGGRRWIVYTGSLDNSVKVWRVSEHVPELRMFQGFANRASGSSPPVGMNNRWHFHNEHY